MINLTQYVQIFEGGSYNIIVLGHLTMILLNIKDNKLIY